jgi:hypothetical protein
LAESSILNGLYDQTLSQLAAALLVLAVLYGKWRRCDDPEWQEIPEGWNKDLWIGNFLPTLDDWLDPKATWNDVVARLVEFTFDRHEQVMFQKQRLEACWLTKTDGKFHKEEDLQAHFRSSRHVNALEIFYDLRLVDYRTKHGAWQISKTGKQLLSRLKRGI